MAVLHRGVLESYLGIYAAIAPSRALGDQTYESLARKAETMTTAEIVAYAHGQIDQARAELKMVSN